MSLFASLCGKSVRLRCPLLYLVAFLTLLLALGEAVWHTWRTGGPEWTLEVKARTNAPSLFQVYHRGTGGYREDRSSFLPIWQEEEAQILRFPLPPRAFHGLRLDPLKRNGTVWLEGLQLVPPRGRGPAVPLLDTLEDPDFLHQLTLVPEDKGWQLLVPEGGDDPQLSLLFHPALDLRHSGGIIAAALGLRLVHNLLLYGVLALVGSGLLLLIFRLFSSECEKAARERRGLPTWRRTALMGLAVFLLVWGARLWTIDQFGSDLPYMDQWDGEAADVIIPWLEGTLSWQDGFLHPHNEHRILFTRVKALGLTMLNGQWDNLLEAVVSATIPAFLAALLAILLFRAFPGPETRLRNLCLTLTVLLFALPFAWENIIVGFQSQFHFLMLMALLAFLALLPAKTQFWHARWWLGILFALGGLFTVASGLLIAATVIGLLILYWLRDSRRLGDLARLLPTFLPLGGIIVLGFLLHNEVPWHEPYKAQNVRQFFSTFFAFLAWPNAEWRWLAPVQWMPFLFLLYAWMRREAPENLLTRLSLALGLWTFLQCVATAYSRGGGVGVPLARSMDLQALCLMANVLALFLLANADRRSVHHWPVFRPAMILFVFMTVMGLSHLTLIALGREMPTFHQESRERERNTALFIQTRDPSYMEDKPLLSVPHLDTERIINRLHDPQFVQVLPSSARLPLTLEPLGLGDRFAFTADAIPSYANRPPAFPVFGSFQQGETRIRGMAFLGSFTKDPKFSHIRLEVGGFTGDPNSPHVLLALIDAETGSVTPIVPRQLANQYWKRVDVPAPGERDLIFGHGFTTPWSWAAFTAPREVARGSRWAEALAAKGFYLLFLGGLIFCCLLDGRWTFLPPNGRNLEE